MKVNVREWSHSGRLSELLKWHTSDFKVSHDIHNLGYGNFQGFNCEKIAP